MPCALGDAPACNWPIRPGYDPASNPTAESPCRAEVARPSPTVAAAPLHIAGNGPGTARGSTCRQPIAGDTCPGLVQDHPYLPSCFPPVSAAAFLSRFI